MKDVAQTVRDSIGFIGLGTMGGAIASRLIDAGHSLVVSDIAAERAADWDAKGARFVTRPSDVAQACRVVLLSLPGPAEIDSVVTGLDGLMTAASAGDVIVDLSTNAHANVMHLSERLASAGIGLLDAPVSGGVAAAVKGRLAVLAGGDHEAIDALRPLLGAFATNIFHVGPVGAGTIAKLVNNQIFLTAAVAVQEGFVMAAKAGLDSAQLFDILKSSSAAPYVALAPLFFARNFDAAIFKLGIAAKDVAVALETAGALGVPMKVTEAALGTYRDAVDQGLGDKVFYATLESLERRAGATVAKLPAKP